MTDITPIRDPDHECDFPDTCNVCQGPAPKPEKQVSNAFRARYDGHCGGCNLPIHEGQWICFVDEHVEHSECAP